MKRALTLRGSLRLLGLGAMAYVATIAVVIALRLGPTAIALRRYSERMLEGYSGMQLRTSAFHTIIENIHPLLIAISRGTSPDTLRPRLTALRARVDSLSNVASGVPQIASIPNEMRVEFAAGSVEQSGLEVALTETLANLELGRAAVAARRLEAADSIAGLLDRHVAEAQRLGVRRTPAAARTASGRTSSSPSVRRPAAQKPCARSSPQCRKTPRGWSSCSTCRSGSRRRSRSASTSSVASKSRKPYRGIASSRAAP